MLNLYTNTNSSNNFLGWWSIQINQQFWSKAIVDSFDQVFDNWPGANKYVYNTPKDKLQYLDKNFDMNDLLTQDPQLHLIFASFSSLEFSIFELAKHTHGNELFMTANFIM